MLETRKLAELQDLLELAYGDGAVILASWHSERVVTLTYLTTGHMVYRQRFNLGDSGRWTMIPLSQGPLAG